MQRDFVGDAAAPASPGASDLESEAQQPEATVVDSEADLADAAAEAEVEAAEAAAEATMSLAPAEAEETVEEQPAQEEVVGLAIEAEAEAAEATAEEDVTPEPRLLTGVDAGVTRSHTTWDADGATVITTEVVIAAVEKHVINTPRKTPGADESWPAGETPVKDLEEATALLEEAAMEEAVAMDAVLPEVCSSSRFSLSLLFLFFFFQTGMTITVFTR